MTSFWKTPAEETSAGLADRVEVFTIPFHRILPAEQWPEQFWKLVTRRRVLADDDAHLILSQFCGLELGEPKRCHTPPWGVAFYKGNDLLLTTTICFRCSNAYVYTSDGKDLRAFDSAATNAIALCETLQRITESSESSTR